MVQLSLSQPYSGWPLKCFSCLESLTILETIPITKLALDRLLWWLAPFLSGMSPKICLRSSPSYPLCPSTELRGVHLSDMLPVWAVMRQSSKPMQSPLSYRVKSTALDVAFGGPVMSQLSVQEGHAPAALSSLVPGRSGHTSPCLKLLTRSSLPTFVTRIQPMTLLCVEACYSTFMHSSSASPGEAPTA